MKTIYRAIFIALVLLLSNVHNIVYTQWQPDTRLTNDTAISITNEACGRNISVWKNYIHICWADKRSGYFNLYYKRSSNFGETWSPDMRLTTDTFQLSRPVISSDKNTIFIVWEDNRNGNEIYYKKSDDYGLSWSNDTRLTDDPAVSMFPSVFVKNNDIHVVWTDRRVTGNGEVYYKMSTNNGITWSTDLKISNSLTSDYFPSISAVNNTIHIIWEDRRFNVGTIYYRRSTDYGITWENEMRLTFSTPPNNWMPALSVSGINIQIGWIAQQNTGNFEVFNMYSQDNGATWSNINKITTGLITYTSSVSISNKNNFVYLTWQDERTGDKEIYYSYSTNNGSNWIPEQRLTYAAGNSQFVSGSVNFNKLFNIWTDDRDGNREIYFKKNNSGGNLHSVSGIVTYSDNNQPVNGGYAKALYFDATSNQVFTIDSTIIQPNGYYIFNKIPEDTLDLMYYQDDDLLQFVPTYYLSTIDWRESQKIYAYENLTNINPRVFRINNQNNPYSISGQITIQGNNGQIPLDNCIIYAKIGNEFKNFAISNNSGQFTVTKLPAGTYNLLACRFGLTQLSQYITISNSNINNIQFNFVNPIGIENTSSEIPAQYSLSQNYPNPFNPSTKINFSLPSGGNVKLEIFDVLGKSVNTIVNEELKASVYSVDWNAGDYPSGIYFYRLSTENFTETRKMILIK